MQVLCDVALFDGDQMTWTPPQPKPYFLCAHSGVAMPLPLKAPAASAGLGVPTFVAFPKLAHGSFFFVQLALEEPPSPVWFNRACCQTWHCCCNAEGTSSSSLDVALAAEAATANGTSTSQQNGAQQGQLTVLLYGGFSGNGIDGAIFAVDPGVAFHLSHASCRVTIALQSFPTPVTYWG